MDFWRVVPWAVAGIVVPFALYGLHRLCLWLEARGHLYYLTRQPEGGSPLGSLAELQKALHPTTKHVMHVREEKRRRSEDEAPGQGEAPPG
jgi:hypothetical protein